MIILLYSIGDGEVQSKLDACDGQVDAGIQTQVLSLGKILGVADKSIFVVNVNSLSEQ